MIVLEFKQVSYFFSICFYFNFYLFLCFSCFILIFFPFYLFLCFTCENFMYRRIAIQNKQVKFRRGDFSENFGEFSSKNGIFTNLSAISVQSTCDQSLKNMKLCVWTQTPPKPKINMSSSWSTTRLTCQFVKY